MQMLHQGCPDRRGAAGAADIPHGIAAGITDPDADRIAFAPAHDPVVAHVLAGAGLDGSPETGVQQAIGAEGDQAGVVVGEYLANDEGSAAVDGLAGARGGAGAAHPVGAGGFFRSQPRLHLAPAPAICERTVGVGELQQVHLGAAQREAVAVVVPGAWQRDAELAQLARKRVDTHHADGAYGRHVERVAQRGAHRGPALEMPVVVLRDVKSALRRYGGRRIVQQRGSGEATLGNGLRIQQRLEGGARLAWRQHGVHLGAVAGTYRGTDPGQHLAAGVVQYQHGAVLHVAACQLMHLALQLLHGQALQGGGEGAAQLRTGRLAGQKATRQMRRHPVAG